jgi:hypothetical protein
MTRPISALLAVLALALAGCGAGQTPSEDFSGAEADVAEVVEELQQAAQEDEVSRICSDILSAGLARRLGDDCQKTVEAAIDDTDVFEVTAESVRITGDRARVRVETGRDGERKEQLELVREGGDWRIDRFGGDVES